MPNVLLSALRKKRRGATIIESLILMIVLAVTFGAVFLVLGAAQRTHAHSRADRESRELIFNWVQVFGGMWEPELADDASALMSRAHNAIANAASMMGGSVTATGPGNARTVQVRGFSLVATPTVVMAANDRRLDLHVAIARGGNRNWVDLTRTFSGFPNDLVVDWGVIP